jgi:hypothetical protein
MWMDATVYLTSCVPKYIQEADLFFYTNDNSFDTRRTFENWFIRAKSNSKVLTCIRNCLYEFWKREKHCKEYFIWNLFAYHAAIKYPNEITNMAAVPHNICYLLGNILMDPYNNELLETIKGLTSVHKLSYKYDFTKATEKSLYSVLSRSTI